jgi:hypothetical protein
MNNRMQKLIQLLALLVLVSMLFIPVSISAGNDEFGNEVVVPTPTVILCNDEPVKSDEYGNYPIDNYGIASIKVVVGDEPLTGSLVLSGTGLFNLESDFNTSGGITILGGEFYTNDFQIDCGSFYIGLYTDYSSIYVNLSDSTINTFSFAIRGSMVKLDPGTSHITTTLLFDDTDKTGHTYYDVTIKSKSETVESTTYVPRTVSYADIKGKTTTQTVYDPVITQTTHCVYGFIEGESVFLGKLEMDNEQGVYIKHIVEAKQFETVVGSVHSAETVKISVKPGVIAKPDPKPGIKPKEQEVIK